MLCPCLGKSTYTRSGIIVNVTPPEPEWEGVITIEISKTTHLPAKIYAGEGVAQVLFFVGDQVCEAGYATDWVRTRPGPASRYPAHCRVRRHLHSGVGIAHTASARRSPRTAESAVRDQAHPARAVGQIVSRINSAFSRRWEAGFP